MISIIVHRNTKLKKIWDAYDVYLAKFKWVSDDIPHQAEVAYVKENSIMLLWTKHFDLENLRSPYENILEDCNYHKEALTSLKPIWFPLDISVELIELNDEEVESESIYDKMSETIQMIRQFDSEFFSILSKPKSCLVNKSLQIILWDWKEYISVIEETINTFISILFYVQDSKPYKKTGDWLTEKIYEFLEENMDVELKYSGQSVRLFHDPFGNFDPFKLCDIKFYGQLFAGYDPNFLPLFKKSKELYWELCPFNSDENVGDNAEFHNKIYKGNYYSNRECIIFQDTNFMRMKWKCLLIYLFIYYHLELSMVNHSSFRSPRMARDGKTPCIFFRFLDRSFIDLTPNLMSERWNFDPVTESFLFI